MFIPDGFPEIPISISSLYFTKFMIDFENLSLFTKLSVYPFSENSQKLATNLSDVIYLLNFVSTRENGLLKTNLHLRFFDFWNFLFKNIGNCSLSSTLSSIIHVSPQSQPFLCIHAVRCYPALVYKLSEKETFLSPWS